jgi:hypothetical protein
MGHLDEAMSKQNFNSPNTPMPSPSMLHPQFNTPAAAQQQPQQSPAGNLYFMAQPNELLPGWALPPALKKRLRKQRMREKQKELAKLMSDQRKLNNYRQHLLLNNVQKLKSDPRRELEQQLAATVVRNRIKDELDRKRLESYFDLPPKDKVGFHLKYV